jgi:hypothetical protein
VCEAGRKAVKKDLQQKRCFLFWVVVVVAGFSRNLRGGLLFFYLFSFHWLRNPFSSEFFDLEGFGERSFFLFEIELLHGLLQFLRIGISSSLLSLLEMQCFAFYSL